MDRTLAFVFGLALACQVLGAPQVEIQSVVREPEAGALKITVNPVENVVVPDKVVGVELKQNKEEETTAAAPEVSTVSLLPPAPTTLKPLPDRVRETIQGALGGVGNAIRQVPTQISAAFGNLVNGVRQVLGRPTPGPTPTSKPSIII